MAADRLPRKPERLTPAQQEAVRRNNLRATRRDAMLDGVQPRAGLWIVHHARRRAYGPIVMVRSTGVVVWREGDFGALVETEAATLYDGRYSYAESPPADYDLVRIERQGAA